jgi:hypothetical protein
MACYLNKQVLIKKFPYDAHATYPDFNSNNEVYINGDFLEIETLGPFDTSLPANMSNILNIGC